jgi:hypothetical protein
MPAASAPPIHTQVRNKKKRRFMHNLQFENSLHVLK